MLRGAHQSFCREAVSQCLQSKPILAESETRRAEAC